MKLLFKVHFLILLGLKYDIVSGRLVEIGRIETLKQIGEHIENESNVGDGLAVGQYALEIVAAAQTLFDLPEFTRRIISSYKFLVVVLNLF